MNTTGATVAISSRSGAPGLVARLATISIYAKRALIRN
jgi:hypothetical protein